MYFKDYWFSATENLSIEESCNKFVELIKSSIFDEIENQQTGIYLATSNAGVKPSLNFWASAIEKGPSFVFPYAFPSTLANFPCGYLAKELEIKGPNYTLVGYENTMISVIDHAFYDLEVGEINHALILSIDTGSLNKNKIKISGFLLGRKKKCYAIKRCVNKSHQVTQAKEQLNPTSFLESIFKQVNKKESNLLGESKELLFSIFRL